MLNVYMHIYLAVLELYFAAWAVSKIYICFVILMGLF